MIWENFYCCDLLKIHYLCGDKDNAHFATAFELMLWFAQNSLPLRWQRQLEGAEGAEGAGCDLLKIHYLCGDKDNPKSAERSKTTVVICSKFITFAVTKTTQHWGNNQGQWLWFAQNSLPLRWQRQLCNIKYTMNVGCDLLKIHYLCGDKDNTLMPGKLMQAVVICSKFIGSEEKYWGCFFVS